MYPRQFNQPHITCMTVPLWKNLIYSDHAVKVNGFQKFPARKTEFKPYIWLNLYIPMLLKQHARFVP